MSSVPSVTNLEISADKPKEISAGKNGSKTSNLDLAGIIDVVRYISTEGRCFSVDFIPSRCNYCKSHKLIFYLFVH